jgi:hypothetical protein
MQTLPIAAIMIQSIIYQATTTVIITHTQAIACLVSWVPINLGGNCYAQDCCLSPTFSVLIRQLHQTEE